MHFPEVEISVVLATYNGKPYLKEQITSIVANLECADELVISDDHSSDGTIQLVKELCSDKARIIQPPSRLGPIFNFEHALLHARGKIVVLADQDDIWSNERLSVIRRHFQESNSNYDLLVLNSEIVDKDLQPLGSTAFALLSAGPGLAKNVFRNTYIGCHMAFKRTLLDVALPFPKQIPMHDVWLGLTSELLGSVTFDPTVTMKFRRTGTNYTQSRYSWFTRIRWRLHLLWALLKFYCNRRTFQ